MHEARQGRAPDKRACRVDQGQKSQKPFVRVGSV